MNKPNLIIVGNGMAAGRLVDELLAEPKLAYHITVIGDEPEGSYNRIMLSSVLAQETTAASIIQKDQAFYAAHGITFLGGLKVTEINTNVKTITVSDGIERPYDELVLATGASPARIPALNQKLDGIMSFRTLKDVDRMINASKCSINALVVGGGLLGLEAAYGLAQRGASVTLVHRSPHLLSRQLDQGAGEFLKAVMEHKNIRFELGTEVMCFNGDSHLASATLKNGLTLPCTLAVIATGITPNTALAEHTILESDRGFMVDEHLRTNIKSISALGECCQFRQFTFGLVEPIWTQCQILAKRLGGRSYEPFTIKPVATKLKVSGVNVFSAGEYQTQADQRELLVNDSANNVYRKLLLRNNKIVGIVLFGDTRDGNYFFDLMQQGVDVSADLPNIIFGKAYCQQALEPTPDVA